MEKYVAAIEFGSKKIKLVVGYELDGKVYVLYALTKPYGHIVEAGSVTQTGADITDQCKFMVETPKGLKDLATLPAESLLTGTVHRFHITAPGYHEEYFGLRIEWYEDELFLNGSLKKK